MKTSSPWLSLKDLGRIYGISTPHCGRALQTKGWRDKNGSPTQLALKNGVAYLSSEDNQSTSTLWNSDICKTFLEQSGYQPISREIQIEQWVTLIEALEQGSPAIASTPEQMAEELPKELVSEVNNKLAIRGCIFRAEEEKICA